MDPIDAHKAAKEIRCRYIIPMHYNTWERIRQNTRDFANSLADTKVKPIVLKVGESIEI
jgi:L-ascorbate metabolism protein UlaG (beta-lactamase superfamily)